MRTTRAGFVERKLDTPPSDPSGLALADDSRIAVIGGGPAGSFFTYFAFSMARTVGLDLHVDIFEPRSFTASGPGGCNHCGGIVSESLVQILALEGVNLPATVVQRGIDSYVLHMDVGTVRIDTPIHEKRIAAVYRGNGPRDVGSRWKSFDGYLQELAVTSGATIRRKLVNRIEWGNGRPVVCTSDGERAVYDLIVGAVGINSNIVHCFEKLPCGFKAPRASRTYICEFHLGAQVIEENLGTSMHVFLLDIPRLEFAALIPKGDCVTMCLLGDGIDEALVSSFLQAPEVRECFKVEGEMPPGVCQCFPRIAVSGAAKPYHDRLIMVGDCGVTRLYKDGIGAAYRTAKAAANAAVFHGISEEAFRRHYWPACQAIVLDNWIGKVVFAVSHQMQSLRFSRSAVLRMVAGEQSRKGVPQRMSTILWDVFTGSAPYREVFLRTLHPAYLLQLGWNLLYSLLRWPRK